MITLPFCLHFQKKRKNENENEIEIENENEKKREWNKIWNDKYPFEAYATGRYSLRHVLLGVTLWGNTATGNLASYVIESIM